jgi:predicted dehydrogenase
MNEVARKSGKIFGVMFNQRTNPLFARARELVVSGRLGEPKRLVWIITNWYRTQFYYNSGSWRATWGGEGGGVLVNQCPHNLDLWQWIFGMPREIKGFCGYGKYHDIEVEDDVTAYAEYDNGATAVFITTTGEYPGTNRLEISGDRGKIVIEQNFLKWWSLAEPERKTCFIAQDSSIRIPPDYTEITSEDGGAGHNGILKNFTDAILDGTELLAPGYEGVNSVRISNAIHLSDWTKAPVTLPIDNALFEKLLRERSAASAKSAGFLSKVGNLHGAFNNRWNVNW